MIFQKYCLILILICLIKIKRTVESASCSDPSTWHCYSGNKCIASNELCDGVPNCDDGSDESQVICTIKSNQFDGPKPTKFVPMQSSLIVCKLPPRGTNIIIKEHNGNSVPLESDIPVNKLLLFSCKPGYALHGYNTSICKGDGEWSDGIPSCLAICSDKHPRSGFSTKVTFELNGSDKSNESVFEPNTIAKVTCSNSFKRSLSFFDRLTCTENGWYPPKTACEMICGKPILPLTQFSKGGVTTSITDVPWHVGIYRKNEKNFENICGGSIISPRIVVSAAHCFYDSTLTSHTKLDHTLFQVVAGKFYKTLKTDESNTQIRNIINVWTPEQYRGLEDGYLHDVAIITVDNFFQFTDSIRPVCLYLRDEAEQEIPDGLMGKITAWSELSINDIDSKLETLKMKTLSYKSCSDILKNTSILELRGDKFCLKPYGDAYDCKGVSGSGFVVLRNGLYYLYGIISFAPTTTQECRRDMLLVMTNILNYKDELQAAYDADIKNDIKLNFIKPKTQSGFSKINL